MAVDGKVVIQAVLDAVNVTKQIGNLKKELKDISWEDITEGNDKATALSEAFKSAGTACTVKLTAPIVAAGKAAFNVASDYESATARIQAAFGVTSEEAERFAEIGESIYESGWGDSLEAVDDALIECKSTLRDVSDEDLSTVTTNALMLSQTFGADVNESIRGTNALMEGFGLSATEASDLLTAGMQRGLNYTDELGDNLSEYAGRWGEAGMSASQYFSLLEAGTANGAYNLDKVGDFLNEFLTSLSDGRMEESIGQFSQGTQDVFNAWKEGGATAEDVLNAVVGELDQMPDSYTKAQLASTLWSSLGEDNAMGMITSLAGVEDSFSDVAGAAQEAADAASDSFSGKMQTALRELSGAIEPLGEPLLRIATQVAEVVKSFAEWFAGLDEGAQNAILVIAGIAAAIGPVLSVVGTVIDIMPELTEGFGLVKGAVSALTSGTGLLSGAFTFLTGPVGIVIAVVAALVAGFLYLWNTNEDFRNAVTEIWNGICETFQGVVDFIGGTIVPGVVDFFTGLGETLSGIWEGITTTVSGAWDTICNVVDVAIQLIAEILGLALEILLIPWNFIWENFGTQLTDAWNAITETVQGAIDTVSSVIQSVMEVVGAWWSEKWTTISTAASTVWSAITSTVQGAINTVSGVIQGVMATISSVWSSVWSTVSGVASSVWNGISSTISGIINGISSTISSVFNGVKSTVSSVWNSIKSAIETPIQQARDTVANVIDRIKSCFNFSWSLPHLKLPHLSISGSFSLNPPSVPSFGISWYAQGGVFNGPTVIGVGEAGTEGVVPFDKRGAQPLAEGIADELGDGAGSVTVVVTVNIEKFVNETGESIDELVKRVKRDIERSLALKNRTKGVATA